MCRKVSHSETRLPAISASVRLYSESLLQATPLPHDNAQFCRKAFARRVRLHRHRSGRRTCPAGAPIHNLLEALGGRVPVTVVPATDDLDRPSAQLLTDGQRRSASSALQNWLNASDSALWGLCSNGLLLRLVRDNASLTRPAFVEADLRRIFEGDAFADFAALWLLIHASRFGAPGTLPSDCGLERWRDAGQKQGVAARDKLRDGVEDALLSLGTGFLSHPDNGALRGRLQSGDLPLPEFSASCFA